MQFKLENVRELTKLIRNLANGLVKLDFLENFESFETEVVISASSDLEVRNELKFIPKKYIIVNQEGNGLITKKADTAWTSDYLYLTNNGASEVTATIIFMR